MKNVMSGLALVIGATTLGVAQTTAPHMTLELAGHVNSTPSLAVLGRTVAAVWTATKDSVTNVYLATSSDGGATFSEPRRVNDQDGDVSANNEQPPRVVMAGARNLTVFWSKRNEGPQKTRRDAIRMARSSDGGRTFTPARFSHDPAFTGARGWESLAVGPNGTVHVVWLDGRDAERKMAAAAAHGGAAHKGQPPQDAYHATIAPDGRITEHLLATGVCFCCKTAVAVDARGAVYAAWRHIFPGSMRDIAFAVSTDGGRRFTTPVRVSEDNWELNGCPEDGPALAVDRDGVIHLAWATVVNDGQSQKALFYATSRNGKTFSPRARVPTGTTTPGHPQLALTTGGEVAIVWDEIVNGVRRVAYSRASRPASFQPAQILSGDESASHPVIAPAGADVLVAWTSRPSTGKPSEPSQIKLRRVGAGSSNRHP
jgi:hypothetical protein